MPERLILCAGPYIYEGFKTLDANPDYKPDYCAVLPPLPRELRDGRCQEIYLIHGIDHFYKWEAMELMAQVHEALSDGGILVMEQPNLTVVAEVMLGIREPMTENKELSGIMAIYGDPGYGNPWMCHRWGWTPDSLTSALLQCGFLPEKIKVCRAMSRPFAEGRDFRVEAKK